MGGELPCRFDSSYEIAQSWQRMIDGKNIQNHDLLLLRHEEAEMQLVRDGLTQAQAHILASKQFNYAKAVDEYYDQS